MRIIVFAAVFAVSVSPAVAQEFEFDFDEDFTFDEELSFEIEDEAPTTSLEMSASVGVTRSGFDTLTDSWAAQVNLANQHDLGSLGFLEWAGNIHIADLGDANDVTYDLTRVHLQNSSGDFSWKLGKYRIGWGEIEGAPVLDVVNSGMSLESVGLPSDELPGQWFAGLDYFLDTTTISGFAGASPEVSHLVPTPDSTDIEFGGKAQFQIEEGSVSLYAGHLVPQTGVLDLSSGSSSAKPYKLVGISANKSFDDVLVEIDLAGKFGLERSTLSGLSNHDRIDAAIGFEYAASNTLQITGAIIGQHWLEQTDAYLLPGSYPSPQTTASYMVMASDTYLDGKLSVSANFFGALDSSMNVTALSANYTLTDAIKIGLSAMWMNAETGGAFEIIDGSTQYGLTATYFY